MPAAEATAVERKSPPSVHGGEKTGHWSVGGVLMRAE